MSARLQGERVMLRPLREGDAPRLAALAAEPEVASWWPGLSEAAVRELLAPGADVTAFAVEHEEAVIGLAQFAEEEDPDYRHASVDLFLGAAWHGRGLGADTVRTLVRHLLEDRGHHRVTIDPRADNERAIRAYESVGFRRVGVMRRYERGADGEWHDGLLLDLLAGELR
ncbi:MAG TPA: GNAT family protein [Gaiellaceae bacterium]|nr:GNAT family protein [Gaiellaceae bacterium]